MDTKLLERYENRMEFPGKLMSGNPQNYVGMALCVSCTIFFRWGWQEDKKEAVCKALDREVASSKCNTPYQWRDALRTGNLHVLI